jgi:D-glycero-D-manno-heptose 1,7-bisphosphate phosphatase
VTRRRAVFLDRDGVLNEARIVGGVPHPPRDVDEVRMLPGAVAACHRLADTGWLLVVVTNQPDIARGGCTRADVDAINAFVTDGLPIEAVVVCPHDDADDCRCRKPRPGMLLDAAARFGVDLAASWMVGDRWRDVEAGRRAGTRTIRVGDGYPDEPKNGPDRAGANQVRPDRVAADLASAVDMILGDW